MSQKPVDFDRAIEGLRAETPRPDAVRRARISLEHRRSRTPRALVLAAAAVAVTVIVWPRSGVDSAWAQTVANTLDAPIVVRTITLPNGRESLKEWRSGTKWARLIYGVDGRLLSEMRSDGVREIVYLDSRQFSPRAGALQPNAFDCARLGPATRSTADTIANSIDNVLKQPGIKVISMRKAASAGQMDRYKLQFGPNGATTVLIDADPVTGRIRRFLGADGRVYGTCEYPSSIPDSVFVPRLQVAKGVLTIDKAKIDSITRERIASGLGRRGPIVLRLVTLDQIGNVWVFWTGAMPDWKMNAVVRLPGVRCGYPFGLKEFSNQYRMSQRSGVAPSLGQHLGGMAMTPRQKIGDRIHVDVPYPGGVARFSHVPVLRLDSIDSISEAIGLKSHIK